MYKQLIPDFRSWQTPGGDLVEWNFQIGAFTVVFVSTENVDSDTWDLNTRKNRFDRNARDNTDIPNPAFAN